MPSLIDFLQGNHLGLAFSKVEEYEIFKLVVHFLCCTEIDEGMSIVAYWWNKQVTR